MFATHKALFNLPKLNGSDGTHSTLCGPVLRLFSGWMTKRDGANVGKKPLSSQANTVQCDSSDVTSWPFPVHVPA